MGVPEKSVAITELIPQRPPMVMVDRFECIDAEDQSHTSLTVREDNLFVEEGALTECGLIEHMAQSAAARVGWRCREAGEKVPVGFIGAVSRFRADALPPVGARLETTLRMVQEVGPLSLAALRVECDGQLIAEGNLKIYLQL